MLLFSAERGREGRKREEKRGDRGKGERGQRKGREMVEEGKERGEGLLRFNLPGSLHTKMFDTEMEIQRLTGFSSLLSW